MIIFFEKGRLGNQLIQYIGLKNLFPRENLIFFGCESLLKVFKNLNSFFLKKENISQHTFVLIKRIVFFLVKIRIFGKIEEHRSKNKYKVIAKKGLFWKIFIVIDFYYNLKDVNKNTSPPLIKSNLIKQAKNWFQLRKINFKDSPIVFVDIRRGDYINFPSKKFPAVLNLKWYKKAMRLMKTKIKNPIFILMSDDKYYLEDIFNESKTFHICDVKPEVKIAIMSLCNYGILSASTFSWIGSYYSILNNASRNFFIAPKYWIYHRIKKNHISFDSDFINYI